MASAITKISTVTASGSSSSMDFIAIPQTYEDLIIKVDVRSSRAIGTIQDGISLRFNSVSTSSYAYQTMYSDAGAAQGDLSASATSLSAGFVPTSNSTANVYSNGEIYITDYADTTHYKSVKSDFADANDGSQGYLSLIAGTFLSNSAINSISLLTGSGQNWVAGSTATLYGVTKAVGGTGSKATGGTVTTAGGYTYHTFFTSGTLIPTTNITGAEVLVVAGGGGTTTSVSGGGGAGGLIYASSQSFTSGTNYTAIVGAGGSADTNGNNSVFAGLTVAIGGGTYQSNGGSGGGQSAPGSGSIGSGTAGQGNNGGARGSSYSGGGGGAGGAGGTGGASSRGGDGGAGVSTYSAWGSSTGTGQNISGTYWYAGGGGGSAWNGVTANNNGGNGGNGGGGKGGEGGASSAQATNGLPFTGGGAGGDNTSGKRGGSGIVIVRYTT